MLCLKLHTAASGSSLHSLFLGHSLPQGLCIAGSLSGALFSHCLTSTQRHPSGLSRSSPSQGDLPTSPHSSQTHQIPHLTTSQNSTFPVGYSSYFIIKYFFQASFSCWCLHIIMFYWILYETCNIVYSILHTTYMINTNLTNCHLCRSKVGPLWPMCQIWPTACFCVASKLGIVSHFYMQIDNLPFVKGSRPILPLGPQSLKYLPLGSFQRSLPTLDVGQKLLNVSNFTWLYRMLLTLCIIFFHISLSPWITGPARTVNARVVPIDVIKPTCCSSWHVAGTCGLYEQTPERLPANHNLDTADLSERHSRHTLHQVLRAQRWVKWGAENIPKSTVVVVAHLCDNAKSCQIVHFKWVFTEFCGMWIISQ